MAHTAFTTSITAGKLAARNGTLGAGSNRTTDVSYADFPAGLAADIAPHDSDEFHDFMCWLSGFGDGGVPSEKGWDVFKQKTAMMAGAFYAYRRDSYARKQRNNSMI